MTKFSGLGFGYEKEVFIILRHSFVAADAADAAGWLWQFLLFRLNKRTYIIITELNHAKRQCRHCGIIIILLVSAEFG